MFGIGWADDGLRKNWLTKEYRRLIGPTQWFPKGKQTGSADEREPIG